MKKILSAIMIFTLMASLSGCDDENDIRNNEEYEKESAEWSKNYGKENTENLPTAVITHKDGTKEVFYYEDTEETAPEGTPREIFKVGSDLAVENGGKNTEVTIPNNVYATEIWTYHYNGGKGAPGGTIRMIKEDGTEYGPWSATSKNTYYWVAPVNQTLPAGTYTVVDSDPGTWSQNGETRGQGMAWMMGIDK